MVINVSRDYPRLWSVLNGVLLVATDLHGDWQAYTRIRDHFLNLHARGAVDGLVFTGDLIHRDPQSGEDASLDILLDIMRLRGDMGDAVLCLLGNHEMPHIYGTTLARGEVEYTPLFELDLQESGLRAMIRKFLGGLPFYLRTSAGVSIAHAGAAPGTAEADTAGVLFRWDHAMHLAQAEDLLAGRERPPLRAALARAWQAKSYADLAKAYMGIEDESDAHYDDLLLGFLVSRSPAYDLLWDALFTRCERQYGKAYPQILDQTLEQLSTGFVRQTMLVSGHMPAAGGVQVVAGKQLRLDGKLIRFDAAKAVSGVEELKTMIEPIA